MKDDSWSLNSRVHAADDKPVFHVVILYQNSAAGRRAKHFYDKLVRAFDGACDFSLELWNFKLIAIPEIRESTAQAAAHADLVILSLYANSGLPAELKVWIEGWPRLIIHRDPARVALVAKSKLRCGATASILSYLRSVADRYGVSFFAHTFSHRSANGE
jgi:hypothetical protein